MRAWGFGRLLVLAGAVLLAGCAERQQLRGEVNRYLAGYHALPHYRAFAVARGTSYAQSYSAGWTRNAPTVQAAIQEALANCNRGHDASLLAPCRLYELGNIPVYSMDAEQLALAECVYARNPNAKSIEGASMADCAGPGGGRSFERYRTLGLYRALASTGDLEDGGATIGWSRDDVSIGSAIAAALRDCEKRRQPGQPRCTLHAIGDVVLPDATPLAVERATCLAITNPAATTLGGPEGARCTAAVAATPRNPSASGPETVIDADAIRSTLVGNTGLSVSGPSLYVHLAADGTAALRTARDPQRDSGRWRLAAEDQLCLLWQKLNAGREVWAGSPAPATSTISTGRTSS